MVNIPMKTSGAVDSNSVLNINSTKIRGALDRNSINELNRPAQTGAAPAPQSAAPGYATPQPAPRSAAPQPAPASRPATAQPAPQPAPVPAVPHMSVPRLENIARKGQKLPLGNGNISTVKACLGWNIKNPACDVDVSAFLLSGGKVISDDWFVFYGHTQSPDGSVVLGEGGPADRKTVRLDLTRMDPAVDKIVFVLTINEALEKRLNFSMLQDAYIRILDGGTGSELVSFMMDEYYENVASMMIGEVYKHNGAWKFNAVGNGVARDLAGLCELYGVQTE